MNTILKLSLAPQGWFHKACSISFPICLCLMFIPTGILKLVLLSNLWRISLILSLVSGWVTCRAGSIMQTPLSSSTQFELCSFPSFDTFLTKTPQHASACSAIVITGKERKQYVGHSTSLLPGMISTVFNTESLFAGSVLDTCSLSFFSVLSLSKSGWPSHTLSLSWDC